MVKVTFFLGKLMSGRLTVTDIMLLLVSHDEIQKEYIKRGKKKYVYMINDCTISMRPAVEKTSCT